MIVKLSVFKDQKISNYPELFRIVKLDWGSGNHV